MEFSQHLPELLDEQRKIIEWARELQKKYFNAATVIEFLVSDNKIAKPHKDLGIAEMREIYKQYAPSKEVVLTAILLDNYRLRTDIKEGQIVTDGDLVGYAYDVDYKERTFKLYSSKERDRADLIDTPKLDGFKKLV